MDKETKPIPDALLKLLTKPWRGSDDGYSSFEAVWNDDIDEDDRRRDPSFYNYSSDMLEHYNNAFSGTEIKSLINAGVLDCMHRRYENGFCVNEHAEHALSDFCGEVYDAWRELNARFEIIQRERSI